MYKFKTAMYCRISHDDLNQQSESIDNQRLIIESYINEHKNEFELVKIYIDDGISGMTYDRAAFTEMMSDINIGKINAIIVKDLSRIGREQIETLNLIKKEFVVKNIRFIAITDNFDSFDSCKSDGLSTSFKLLLNDYYCADISKKVRSAQSAKMKKGDFIGSYAPYGYNKSPENKNQLVIDEYASQIVKRIFNMYLSGAGKLTIAKTLNNEGILNPTMYKREVQKLNYVNSNKLTKTKYWTYSTIHKILSNPVYTGSMVQHKTEIKAYNIHKKIQVPKNKWYVFENAHQPIIDNETFNIVQNMLKTKRVHIETTENLSKYTGLLFCKECGRAMNKFLSKPKKNGSRYITFKCSTYSKLGKQNCTIHSIKESELDEILIKEINKFMKQALDSETCEYIRNNSLNEDENKQKDTINNLNEKLDLCYNKRKTMLKYLSENIINTEDFKEFDTENKKEIETIKKQISNTEEQIKNKKNQYNDYTVWLENILKHKEITEINRELLVNLVDRIYVSEVSSEKSVEVGVRFKGLGD
ncbi:putative uncharacterized protein [Eubacterium sp. CAG:274]|nr:putative uncharacterized protein [Eubacterium sp. CAG:274]